MYYIYKYTNRTNGKVYIGQTNNLKKRYNGHKSCAYNPKSKDFNIPFHNAIRKYGIENFSYEAIEEIDENESHDFVNDRERFFIEYYQSLTTQNGYNYTFGGEGCPRPKKTYEELLQSSKIFSPAEIKDIQNRLIKDEEFNDIEKLYTPRLQRSFLRNINTGLSFHNPDFDYPLKKYSRSKFTKSEIEDIKSMIKAGVIYSEIAKKYNIKSNGFISMINTGKYFFDKNESYPLKNKIGSKAQNEIWVDAIRQDIISTNLSLKEIAEKHNRSYSTIKNISSGRSHKKEELQYPLR